MYDDQKVLPLRLDLQFFANDEGGEKTEEPTAKKIEDTRKEGQVAKSKELTSAVQLFSLFLCLRIFMKFIGERLIDSFNKFYRDMGRVPGNGFTHLDAWKLLMQVLLHIALVMAPFLIVAFVASLLSQSLQFKWMVTAKPLKPKFNKLNPISGFKNLFSKEKLFDLLLSVAKILVFGMVAYSVIKDHLGVFVTVYDLSINDALAILYDMVLEILLKISFAYLILALADFIFQKMKHKKDIMMSKQEVKDEYKNQEGDPHIKSQQRQRMQQASRRRMMQAVPEADVVITNPTHYACALKYDNTQSQAPVLVAKGADYLAYKIRDLAYEANVAVVENKPLARMLYANVEIGNEIPPELYQAVAEVLAYVYQLEKRTG